MTKLGGANSLVALALLGCLVWTEAEAQHWRNSGQSISNFASLHPRSGNSGQTPRDPKVTIPQKPYQSNSQGTQLHYEAKTPQQTPFHSCEVTVNERISCGAPDISAERCDAISCCFDGRQCYFPKAGGFSGFLHNWVSFLFVLRKFNRSFPPKCVRWCCSKTRLNGWIRPERCFLNLSYLP